MKGIILAGGKGSRLDPLTQVVSKQLLPVYDKPLIYYPLSMLMLAGIRSILIISSPEDLPQFRRLFGNGEKWGLDFAYAEQESPRGIAEALIIGKHFIGKDSVCLILGDNIFYGANLGERLERAANLKHGAVIFAYQVSDPSHYAVVTFKSVTSETGIALTLEEKPNQPKSSYAVPGLYFYDNEVCELVNQVKPSKRKELEITDLNKIYLDRGNLQVEVLGRGVAWLDAGRPETLLQAAHFIQVVEERQGLMVSCPEEIAYRKGYIGKAELKALISGMGENSYRSYLENFLIVASS
jgi:glucose-1-phosphate thymidylyltransferase